MVNVYSNRGSQDHKGMEAQGTDEVRVLLTNMVSSRSGINPALVHSLSIDETRVVKGKKLGVPSLCFSSNSGGRMSTLLTPRLSNFY